MITYSAEGVKSAFSTNGSSKLQLFMDERLAILAICLSTTTRF